jgi:REP element-mobilizing transposase RayT
MKQRKPNRLKYFDYSNAGWYYVTICTKDHQHKFGSVINEKMILNETGKAADKMWLNIPAHYPFAELDEYIIMPNHIHGIIIIDYDIVGDEYLRPLQENTRSLHRTNLSNVIKGFKIGVTNWCKLNNHSDFKWQRSFYDRIIRNEIELFNIRKYIKQNPLKWDLEKNIENLEF